MGSREGDGGCERVCAGRKAGISSAMDVLEFCGDAGDDSVWADSCVSLGFLGFIQSCGGGGDGISGRQYGGEGQGSDRTPEA